MVRLQDRNHEEHLDDAELEQLDHKPDLDEHDDKDNEPVFDQPLLIVVHLAVPVNLLVDLSVPVVDLFFDLPVPVVDILDELLYFTVSDHPLDKQHIVSSGTGEPYDRIDYVVDLVVQHRRIIVEHSEPTGELLIEQLDNLDKLDRQFLWHRIILGRFQTVWQQLDIRKQ